MSIVRFLVAIPAIILMVAAAKAAQYASVDAFGASLGFDLASLLGVAPVIALYVFAAIKLPDFTKVQQA